MLLTQRQVAVRVVTTSNYPTSLVIPFYSPPKSFDSQKSNYKKSDQMLEIRAQSRSQNIH